MPNKTPDHFVSLSEDPAQLKPFIPPALYSAYSSYIRENASDLDVLLPLLTSSEFVKIEVMADFSGIEFVLYLSEYVMLSVEFEYSSRLYTVVTQARGVKHTHENAVLRQRIPSDVLGYFLPFIVKTIKNVLISKLVL